MSIFTIIFHDVKALKIQSNDPNQWLSLTHSSYTWRPCWKRHYPIMILAFWCEYK